MIKIVLFNSYKTVPKNKWFDKYLLKPFESSKASFFTVIKFFMVVYWLIRNLSA
jgi:hypothetical protein